MHVMGFRAAERLLVPTAVLGEVVEYLLPARLSGLSAADSGDASRSAIAPVPTGLGCVLAGDCMFEAART